MALAALQIAKHIGATVWVTSGSPDKLERARRSAPTICSITGSPTWGGKSAPAPASAASTWSSTRVGEATWSQSLVALGKRGRLVTCGGTSGPHVQVDVRRMFWNQWTLMGSTMGSDAEFDAMTELFRQGALQPPGRFRLVPGGRARGVRTPRFGAQFGKVVVCGCDAKRRAFDQR